MKPLLGQLPRNQRGSAFLQALVAIAVVGILLYWLSPRVIKHREQVTRTASIVTARLAMHSMLDYTLLGVKQRWCFSATWMPESCGSTTVAILSHPRSVERLLMKGDTVTFLTSMGVTNASEVPLDEGFEVKLNLKDISSLHPVYRILADLKAVNVSSMKISIKRNTNSVVPEYGREMYLVVHIQMLDPQGNVLTVGSSTLDAKSFVGVYPREVGGFALMLPSDLYLTNPSSKSVGDAVINTVGSRLSFVSGSRGLVFDSPVFVNGSIHLPPASGSSSSDSVYAPVAFKEKVIMGDGSVMRGTALFSPQSAGKEGEQFWTDVKEFGGFLKGVDVDGVRDQGLDVLSGKTSSNSSDATLMQMCIQRTLAMNDLSQTKDASLYGQISNSATNKFDFRLGLDYLDRFTRQRSQPRSPSASRNSWVNWSSTGLKGDNGAIAGYKIVIDNPRNTGEDLTVQGDIPDNGSVAVSPKVDLSSLEAKVSDSVRQIQSTLTDLGNDSTRLDSKIKSYQSDLTEATAKLAAAQSQSTSTGSNSGSGNSNSGSGSSSSSSGSSSSSSQIAQLKSEIASLTTKIAAAEKQKAEITTQIDTATAKLAETQTQLNTIRSNMQLQPVIQLTVDVPDPTKGSNPSFKDFHVSVENEQVLVDRDGTPVSFKVYVEAYDVGYDQGTSIRTNASSMKTNGWLNFTRSGTSVVAPKVLTDSRGVSRGSLPDGDINYDIDAACAKVKGSSFGGADWSVSFAANSLHSWSFTDKYGDLLKYTFSSSNASLEGKTATFVVKSIAKECVIDATADFVSGFLTCESLKILDRSTPLRIIGSFIVTKDLQISASAIRAGIRWSSIYQPMATYELRQAGVLTGQNNVSCDSINRFPVWHPKPSIVDVSNLYRCNAISLRSKADPFRWTAVDPDCGLLQNSNSTRCKNRMVNFYVLEVSRESGI